MGEKRKRFKARKKMNPHIWVIKDIFTGREYEFVNCPFFNVRSLTKLLNDVIE